MKKLKIMREEMLDRYVLSLKRDAGCLKDLSYICLEIGTAQTIERKLELLESFKRICLGGLADLERETQWMRSVLENHGILCLVVEATERDTAKAWELFGGAK